jgi:hypothetical protein
VEVKRKVCRARFLSKREKSYDNCRKNILLKIIEDTEKRDLLRNGTVKKFVSISNLCTIEMKGLIARACAFKVQIKL